jgi:DNA repair protein RecO (recombination protein O)
MPRFKDQAICLREIDWSETSQIVVLLTQQRGKIRGLAKGSKRMSPSHLQRFSGGIFLLNLGQVLATTRRTAQLATITEWDLQSDFHHLRTHLPAQRLAMYAAELSDAFSPELDPRPATFQALHHLLDDLREAAFHQTGLLRFQWTVLDEGGFRPELFQDVERDAPLTDRRRINFDPIAGGFTHAPAPGGWAVRWQTLQLLRALDRGETLDSFASHQCRRANQLLCVYARAILQRELATMRLILADNPTLTGP